MAVPKLLVVGGNGFLGSAICKSAVAKGWQVISMSSSGKPYATPASHTPSWVNSVSWNKASAFHPDQYQELVSESSAVIHTLGILLEDAGYKKAIRDGDVWGLMKAFSGLGSGSGFGGGNPLASGSGSGGGGEGGESSYEGMNRDSALRVCETFLSTPGPSSSSTTRRPFIYISAADVFRPFVPRRYVESKRQAELGLARICEERNGRGVFMRPGLMYHPHLRPLSTLPAFFLSQTASLADKSGFSSDVFASKSALGGLMEGLKTHPIHVDHVAEACLRCVVEEGREGVVNVEEMRRWAGFRVREKERKREEGVEGLHG